MIFFLFLIHLHLFCSRFLSHSIYLLRYDEIPRADLKILFLPMGVSQNYDND
jgi:hypothetical protein